MSAMSQTHSDIAFATAYNRLNEAQKRAVDAIEGPVMVMAGPGTGKTQVLTLRIANILKHTDTPPDAILALTYTNSGVTAMRERLRTLIGQDAYRVNISTFHGYASSVIESHPASFPRIIGATSADDVDRYDVVRTAIANVGADVLRPSGDPEYYVKPILGLIGSCKNDAVTSKGYDEYLATLSNDESAYDEQGEPTPKVLRSAAFVHVFDEYERLMRERGLYDYSDMLVELVSALERDESLRLELAESAQYILADEHQDANRSQNRILELLATAHPDGEVNPNLFIVGDDKQAIYRFQGASLENFLFFKDRFPNARVIPLTLNYRSTARILAAAGKVIEGKALVAEPLVSIRSEAEGEGDPFELIVADTINDEVMHVVDRIDACIKSGVAPEEIAILLRKNRDIDPFVRALRARNIPYVSLRDSDALATAEIGLLLALIRASVDPMDTDALAKALFLPAFAIPTGTLARLFSDRVRSKKSLFEMLAGDPVLEKAHQFFDAALKVAHTKGAIEALDYIVAESGFLAEVVNARSLTHALAAFRSVRALFETRSLRDHRYTLKDAVVLLADLENGVAPVMTAREEGSTGVRVMSLHKSKGLEFEHVFLPHSLESRFKPRAERALFFVPLTVNQPEPDWDDERRLFYVGITRAKRTVHASVHRMRNEDKEERPLSFLGEVGEYVESTAPRVSTDILETHRPNTTEVSAEYTQIIEAFLKNGISATALNAYLADPWECFLKSIIRLPETQAPHQMYGTAIHAALERIYTELKEGEQPSVERLVAVFTEVLARQPMRPHERATFHEKGVEALRGYFEEYDGSWNTNAETEVAIAVDLPLPPGHERETVHIRGFIDRLETEGSTTRVFDYKTGKVKSRNEIMGATQSSDGSIYRQLVFYKILLDLDGRYRMTEAVVDFVEPNPRGKHKREAFEITDEMKQELIQSIARMTDDLVRGEFLSKPSISEDPLVRGMATLLAERFSVVVGK
jgi:DNA helicase-2/ATP-dependent DNA helicase PcrA